MHSASPVPPESTLDAPDPTDASLPDAASCMGLQRSQLPGLRHTQHATTLGLPVHPAPPAQPVLHDPLMIPAVPVGRTLPPDTAAFAAAVAAAAAAPSLASNPLILIFNLRFTSV